MEDSRGQEAGEERRVLREFKCVRHPEDALASEGREAIEGFGVDGKERLRPPMAKREEEGLSLA